MEPGKCAQCGSEVDQSQLTYTAVGEVCPGCFDQIQRHDQLAEKADGNQRLLVGSVIVGGIIIFDILSIIYDFGFIIY